MIFIRLSICIIVLASPSLTSCKHVVEIKAQKNENEVQLKMDLKCIWILLNEYKTTNGNWPISIDDTSDLYEGDKIDFSAIKYHYPPSAGISLEAKDSTNGKVFVVTTGGQIKIREGSQRGVSN
jgi:hypothetical protein